MTITTVPAIALEKLQGEIGAGNRARGFREQSDRLKREVKNQSDHLALAEKEEREVEDASKRFFDVERSTSHLATHEANLANYAVVKAMLIVTEVAELTEEIRNGHGPSETYYPDAVGVTRYPNDGLVFKPEGVPSELADIVIRSFDFADEFGIDLGAIIEEKLAYNATRGIRHGGKAF